MITQLQLTNNNNNNNNNIIIIIIIIIIKLGTIGLMVRLNAFKSDPGRFMVFEA